MLPTLIFVPPTPSLVVFRVMFLRRFRFLGRLVSPLGCHHLGLLLRVPISRLLGLRLSFRFVVFFIGGFGSSKWVSILWFLRLWIFFGKIALSPAIVARSQQHLVSSSAAGFPCESVAAGGIQIYRFGIRKRGHFLSFAVAWLGKTRALPRVSLRMPVLLIWRDRLLGAAAGAILTIAGLWFSLITGATVSYTLGVKRRSLSSARARLRLLWQ
jgi:hypothetical protein